MPRPLPIVPKGPRRRPVRRPAYLFACPRVSPAYELDAIHALIKPNERTKGRIAHVDGRQAWTDREDAALGAACGEVAARLGFRADVHRGAEGDYWFAIPYAPAEFEEVKALALSLSARLPELWFTLGRLLVNEGRFLRRRYGYKLKLVPATNVHLRRDIRAAMKGLL